MQTKNKIIFVDHGCLMFTSIYACQKSKMDPIWTYLSVLVGNLTKIGLNKEDQVIIAVDSHKGNWRKEIDSAYKADRKEKREKQNIDWQTIFQKFGWLVDRLDMYTPFHAINIDKLEADDIIAYGCRKFKDTECVILASDGDYEQLVVYPNVKIFSPKSKRYKKITNPHKILAKKIVKEAADNLITPVVTKEDYEKRNKIVNLMTLPPEIDALVEEKINFLPEKEWEIDSLTFSETMRGRLKQIYRQDKIISFDKKPRKKRAKKKT